MTKLLTWNYVELFESLKFETLLHHGAPVQPFVRSLHPAIFGLALDPLQAVTFAAMAKS